jgi:hypothetical protein
MIIKDKNIDKTNYEGNRESWLILRKHTKYHEK